MSYAVLLYVARKLLCLLSDRCLLTVVASINSMSVRALCNFSAFVNQINSKADQVTYSLTCLQSLLTLLSYP